MPIMAEAMESACQNRLHGVQHMDFEPCNVIVVDAMLDPPTTTTVPAESGVITTEGGESGGW